MEVFMYATIRLHQACAIASFVMLPVLFIAKKGTPFHKKTGKVLLVVSVALVVFAILTVVNPPFLAYWADDIRRNGWQRFLSIFGLGTAFLWWFAALYSYFFFSALRVWPRFRAARAGRRSSNWFDYLLTAIALTVSAYYWGIAVYYAIVSPGFPRLLPLSTAMVGFGLWDLVTYFRPVTSFRVAALTHGSRMYIAWWMLMIGVLIRQGGLSMRANGGRAGYEITAAILVAMAILLFHWNRQISAPPKAA